MLVRLTSQWVSGVLCAENLLGYRHIIKGKVSRGRRTSLAFLTRCHASIISFSSRIEQGSLLVPTWSSYVHRLLVFHVCREHVLGIINLLTSMCRTWVSFHHCFIVWGHAACFCCMVLLLSEPAWFCDYVNWALLSNH